MDAFSKVFRQLRSINFTLVLLALLIALSAISTFQAAPGEFFSSLGFFAIIFLFFVNLACCTIYRFLKELKKKVNRNFGPDILHGGLILFMIVGLISTYNRMEGQIAIREGETVRLPDGSYLTLEEFEYVQYDNGRPKDWISYLTIQNGNETLYSRYPLRVNHPLKVNEYNLYQYSYGEMMGGVFSVILAVREPFYGLVVISFILCGVGFIITIFMKLKKLRQGAVNND